MHQHPTASADGLYLLDGNQYRACSVFVVIHSNFANRMPSGDDGSFKFLPYQLRMVGYWPTMALTGGKSLLMVHTLVRYSGEVNLKMSKVCID